MNDIKEILDNLQKLIDRVGCFMGISRKEAKLLLDYITNLEEIRKEHNIMKQFIYENGLWERFLNDDRFLKHLRGDE